MVCCAVRRGRAAGPLHGSGPCTHAAWRLECSPLCTATHACNKQHQNQPINGLATCHAFHPDAQTYVACALKGTCSACKAGPGSNRPHPNALLQHAAGQERAYSTQPARKMHAAEHARAKPAAGGWQPLRCGTGCGVERPPRRRSGSRAGQAHGAATKHQAPYGAACAEAQQQQASAGNGRPRGRDHIKGERHSARRRRQAHERRCSPLIRVGVAARAEGMQCRPARSRR